MGWRERAGLVNLNGVSKVDGFVKAMVPVVAALVVYDWFVKPLVFRG